MPPAAAKKSKRTRRLSSGFGLRVSQHASPAARRARASAGTASEEGLQLVYDAEEDSAGEENGGGENAPAAAAPEKKGGKGRRKKASPSASPEAVRQPPKEKLSNVQLAGLYSECIKLAAANKINQKNTWTLSLIDHMSDVLVSDADERAAAAAGGGSVNFQRASCTLDASVQIYAHRVDSVHTTTYKVLGGLSRTGRGGDDYGDDGDDDDNGAAKKRRRAARSTNTIESNPANLNMKNAELQFDVDPLFKKTSASFDEGGASGLLLNSLSVFSGCTIVFDSSLPLLPPPKADEADDDAGSSDRPAAVDMSSLRDLLCAGTGAPAPAEGEAVPLPDLCPDLEGMKRWAQKLLEDSDASMDEAYTAATRADANVLGGAGEADGDYAANDDFDDDDDDGGPIMYGDDDDMRDARDMEARMEAELRDGGAAADAGPDADGTAPPDPPSARSSFGGPGDDGVGAMPLVFAAGGSDFSYLDARALDNWAGASHWKFRASNMAAKRQLAREGGKAGSGAASGGASAAGEPAKRSKKASFYVDFSAAAPAVPETAFARPARSNSTLTEATLSKADPAKNLLPIDVHFKPQRLQSLFLRPNLLLRFRRGAAASPAPAGGSYVDHDSALVCVPASAAGEFAAAELGPQPLVDDNGGFDGGGGCDDDDDGGGFHLFDNDDGPDEVGFGAAGGESGGAWNGAAAGAAFGAFGGGMDMVERPQTVEKVGIKYAKFAKKVDVKKLKASMWDGIAATAEEAPAADAAPSFQATISHAATTAASEGNGDASVPYCFICLLHLCNEKELELVPGGGGLVNEDGAQADLGNFSIVSPA